MVTYMVTYMVMTYIYLCTCDGHMVTHIPPMNVKMSHEGGYYLFPWSPGPMAIQMKKLGTPTVIHSFG